MSEPAPPQAERPRPGAGGRGRAGDLRPVRLYLTRDGFGVQVERDGERGLAAARRLRPAAIILDVGLPGIDGTEVCRALRAEGDWTPLLFVTARDDEVDRVLGLELGADDYLTKPFSPRELVARVRGVLRRAAGPAGAEAALSRRLGHPGSRRPPGVGRRRRGRPDDHGVRAALAADAAARTGLQPRRAALAWSGGTRRPPAPAPSTSTSPSCGPSSARAARSAPFAASATPSRPGERGHRRRPPPRRRGIAFQVTVLTTLVAAVAVVVAGLVSYPLIRSGAVAQAADTLSRQADLVAAAADRDGANPANAAGVGSHPAAAGHRGQRRPAAGPDPACRCPGRRRGGAGRAVGLARRARRPRGAGRGPAPRQRARHRAVPAGHRGARRGGRRRAAAAGGAGDRTADRGGGRLAAGPPPGPPVGRRRRCGPSAGGGGARRAAGTAGPRRGRRPRHGDQRALRRLGRQREPPARLPAVGLA